MSLEEAVPTLQELRAVDVAEVLARAQGPSCWALTEALLEPETLPPKGSAAWKVHMLLGFVTSLRCDVDADAEPFALSTWFGKLGPHALTKEQLDVLAAWLPEIVNAVLRARVADVLWMTARPRSHLHGREAIAAYLQAADEQLRTDRHWPQAIDTFARALALPSSFRPADFLAHLESVLDGKYGNVAGPRDARLMRLMLDYGLGNAAKYGAQAEVEAERLEQQAAGETYATNISLMMAREYWLVAADWRSRVQGVNSPAVQDAKLRAAETHVKEADKARAASQPMVEARFLGDAITALRRAGADRARTDALLSRMLMAQRTAPRGGFSTSVSLTEEVVAGRKAVEGKTLKDAILGLATVASSPAVSTLRDLTTDYFSKSLVGRLFPSIISSRDSRVVAHMPALSSLGNDSTDDERVLRWHMWQQAQWIRMMNCGRIVGAREQIELEHNPRLADLLPLMNVSALVPAGHEGLFAKGIHAGLHGDFVVAIHILLPQLENGLRSFIQDILERPIISHDDDGTQSVSLFKRILTHPDLAKVLGDDLLFDLQGLLIVQESTNLRNVMSHGLLGDRNIGLDAIYAWWLCLRICVMLTPIKPSETESGSVVFAGIVMNQASKEAILDAEQSIMKEEPEPNRDLSGTQSNNRDDGSHTLGAAPALAERAQGD